MSQNFHGTLAAPRLTLLGSDRRVANIELWAACLCGELVADFV